MLVLLRVLLIAQAVVASAGTVLLSSSASGGGAAVPAGLQNTQSIPSSVSTSEGVVTIISSPGTSSSLLLLSEAERSPDAILSLESERPPRFVCRGATLKGTSDSERTSLATCSLLSGAVLLDGITVGDVEAGLQNSRHARTLTALFRARVELQQDDVDAAAGEGDDNNNISRKQTLMLGLLGEEDAIDKGKLEKEIKGLYMAAAVEKKGAAPFEKVYNLQVVPVLSSEEAQKAMNMAKEAAQSMQQQEPPKSLSLALLESYTKVRESGVGAVALDPPSIAQAFVSVGNASTKQSKTARARIAAWRNRVARGLWVDGFGREAESLRKRVLGTFDTETLSAAGLPLVAPYRLEMRSQLQSFLDSAIEELFLAQVSNLEKSTLKRFQGQLLRTVNEPAESVMDSNAAALRKESFNFENVVEDLEVPALGLTKDKAARAMSSKLNDALMSFPDSPAAKIKRTKQVSKVVSRERKPSQRAIGVGLDLVAVLRPDGYGSLQGFCGYQLGGNSITFGIHNDADDPQTIAQFGGVRPPLLRVQPKLRIDVEL